MKPLHALLTGSRRIEDDDLRQLFLDARTHNGWLDKPVPDTVLREIYDIAKFGPTSMNTQPMRLLFLRTAAAKERLRPHLAPAKTSIRRWRLRLQPLLATILLFISICPGCFHITRMRKACSKASCR